ncbi:hypothetical protein EJ04DRAFT_506800 [Polyplosphaeria fusca]|uniref:RanBP2-type domain-containing protein n=1 Tax=Polyplosphaeria fusca TaxID=682080 RepID=A0A9P4QI58_9PLEO|nr:hypothetical protein EJ04DRAFT_506800 [Polyplosphaeria fusca]
MDIPRGHAMAPLNESDFLDFIYNYFKAEYAPIRSFFSTATAEPRQSSRWIFMGHELSPLTFRPANAQAQKDLESLDYLTRKWNLDAGFVRGLVIRYAKYEVHERLEKKLFESGRLDLMVRKALKEKHMVDALWPSPAPKNLAQELLQQGVRVRSWYGDMFTKYFKHLHAVDDFRLLPDVDARIRSSGTLNLVPFVDHLIFGAVDPIMPIVAKGAGYANAAAWKQKDKGEAFGRPERFEVRFDAPAEIEETYTKSFTRQCQCLKCGTKRDVKVVISVDPSAGPVQRTAERERRRSNAGESAKKPSSKAAQKYRPGYNMPGSEARAPAAPQPVEVPVRGPSPVQKKQCPRCTFLNHPELKSCEMCAADLPDTLIAKPPSPEVTSTKPSHSHSASLPPPASKNDPAEKDLKATNASTRPSAPNRQSLSSTIFSIFPFSQQQQTEHHAHLPPPRTASPPNPKPEPPRPKSKHEIKPLLEPEPEKRDPTPAPAPAAPLIDVSPTDETASREQNHPEMTLMPLTPPSTSSGAPRAIPGMPQHLMDDFVPVSPAYAREDGDEDDAGWGEMSREEARGGESDGEEDGEAERRVEMIDLDEVAREEMGVWGD